MKNRLIKVITNKDIENIQLNEEIISLALRLPCKCNLDCSYCYGKIERKGVLLSFNEIKNIILQAYELKARTIEIVGEGEPLLYSKFNDLIKYINQLDMISTLYTNCSLITPKLSEFLYNQNVIVIGKQNSLSPDIQNKICNLDGSYDKIIKGLGYLIDAGFTDMKPSRLGIHTVILKENINDIPKMWRQWRKKNIIPQVQALVYPSKYQSKRYLDFFKIHASSPKETRDLFKNLSMIDRNEFGIIWDPVTAYPIAPDSCRVVYGTLGITQEGNIQICSFTEKPLGNIRDTSLKRILQSDEVKRIRSKDNNFGYQKYGYGCRANAYNMTGDRYGPDPFYDEYLQE